MTVDEKLGSILESERKKRKISRRSFAKHLRKSDVCLLYWEKGKRSISMEDLIAYCNALNIDWLDVMKKLKKDYLL